MKETHGAMLKVLYSVITWHHVFQVLILQQFMVRMLVRLLPEPTFITR